ncbi:hypothetical protein MNBD_GAMMA25-1712 [hydrothermal vent metagenome]|uniref:DUF2069 domain-containing protein n=1 Tax=hydrothermal vent metagenome TaxID=652676 RepID=A0A3B1B520_9ZZZZ
MNLIKLSRITTLASWFALFALLMLWNTLLAPSAYFPISLVLVVMVGPLLFPLRGLLHGKPYTHAWASFLIMLYFAHGVQEAWVNPDERIYALLEVLFSTIFYTAAITYAKLRGRQLKQHAEGRKTSM